MKIPQTFYPITFRLLSLLLAALLPHFLVAQCDPDTEPPVAQFDTLVISCTAVLPPAGTEITFLDNCDPDPQVEIIDQFTDDNFNCGDAAFPQGVVYITRTYEATDVSGNIATADLTIALARQVGVTFPADITWTAEEFADFPNITDPQPLSDDLAETGSGVPDIALGQFCNYALSSETEVLNGCGENNITFLRTWIVLDWCTNSLITEGEDGSDNTQLINIIDAENSTAPTAVCISNIAVEIMPLDSNGDGQPDFCMVELFAADFDNGSTDDTTPAEDLQFYFDSDFTETFRVFTGADLGLNNLLIYVVDEDGCFAVCELTLLISAPAGTPCNAFDTEGVSGQVRVQTGEPINDVTVSIGSLQDITEADGMYDISVIIEAGNFFELIGDKNTNIANGITGADLILIRQHILNVNSIENPVYLRAADINNSGAITGADLVLARQAILGVITEFPNSDSWRFYFNSQPVPEELTESAVFQADGSSQEFEIDFWGYKVGDVNGSADPQN